MSAASNVRGLLGRAGLGLRPSTGRIGALLLVAIALPCFLSLPFSIQRYNDQDLEAEARRAPPSLAEPAGRDHLGRPMHWRLLLGGAISLGVGVGAAVIAVGLGVSWGAVAAYAGGRVDSAMMRIVDVLYSLPYILMVVLVDMGLRPMIVPAVRALLAGEGGEAVGRLLSLFLAIGLVSWLDMARVIRGQVLSLRAQPFVEAARAVGMGPMRILGRHLLPNLVGPIIVYATLTVPSAILQESFLSFLGIGVQAPLPSWGNLASGGLSVLDRLEAGRLDVPWWLLLWPCLLLGLTLMALNFLGDALRARLDPRSREGQ